MKFALSPEGDTQQFTTIEQAKFWLRMKWPVADHAREKAPSQIDAAMHCLVSVSTARRAFVHTALTAGFKLVPAH